MKTATEASDGYCLRAHDFKKMILGANFFFDREKETINALNVFPVPDGDTGTNMSLTLKAAVEGSLAYDGQSIGELSEIVASRALMGARGNSGVILSQILRGLARGLRSKDQITPGELSKAFQYGVVYAYRAVSKPVEGTILTVAREMARGIRAASRKGENLYNSIEEALTRGKAALAKTTDMLPALKEAGVVDAGGLGLLVFFEGCLYAMKQSLNDMLNHRKDSKVNIEHSANRAVAGYNDTEPLNLDFPYCTELIIKSSSGNFAGLEEKLEAHGDSLIMAADNKIAKVHLHTDKPDLVLKTALAYGTIHDIKIDNMLDQHKQTLAMENKVEHSIILPGIIPHEKGTVGIITVSFGEGFREIFLSLGADEIIFGGQTMNPNVEELLAAVNNLPQEDVIILPNNKNIIMVAEQVKALSKKNIAVLETKYLPEGLAALLTYNPANSLEENVTNMLMSMKRIKTGLITYATRDTTIKGEVVRQGELLGLSGDEVITAGQEIDQVSLDLIYKMNPENEEVLTIFYGKSVNQNEAFALAKALEKKYPALEVELQYGGQPIYYYIISLE